MEFKLDDVQKKTAIIAAASAVGVAQTIILKKYLPAEMLGKTIIPQLGEFGKIPALAGITCGSLAIVLSIFVFKDNAYAHAITAYGGGALASGVLSGLGII